MKRIDTIYQLPFIEYFLDNVKELRCGIEALKCPADPLLKWFEAQIALAALQKSDRERLVQPSRESLML